MAGDPSAGPASPGPGEREIGPSVGEGGKGRASSRLTGTANRHDSAAQRAFRQPSSDYLKAAMAIR